jgi:hypothetical protein
MPTWNIAASEVVVVLSSQHEFAARSIAHFMYLNSVLTDGSCITTQLSYCTGRLCIPLK